MKTASTHWLTKSVFLSKRLHTEKTKNTLKQIFVQLKILTRIDYIGSIHLQWLTNRLLLQKSRILAAYIQRLYLVSGKPSADTSLASENH